MLAPSEREKLTILAQEWCSSLESSAPDASTNEVTFTKEQLLPRLQNWVASLYRPTLIVRGDGGMPTSASLISRWSFFPDLEVAEFDQRYVAFEVKILRGVGMSGSISKAIGQAAVYTSRGYDSAHVIVIDLSSRFDEFRLLQPDFSRLRSAGVYVHWYLADRSSKKLNYVSI